MELDSVGSLGFRVGEEGLELEVFTCEIEKKSYYIVRIQRECFERVITALGNNPLVDSRKFEDRDVFFPNNSNSFASESTVITRSVEESGDGGILDERVVDFGQRAFWKTRIRGVVERIITLIKEVFAGNPDIKEILVMVDANGEDPASVFRSGSSLEQA